MKPEPFPPLLGLREVLGVLRVNVLERPCLAAMDAERVPLGRVLHSPHRLDVHQEKEARALRRVSLVAQRRHGGGREVEGFANPSVEDSPECALRLPRRERHDVAEALPDSHEVADLVVVVSVLVPAENERMELDDLVPDCLRLTLDRPSLAGRRRYGSADALDLEVHPRACRAAG